MGQDDASGATRPGRRQCRRSPKTRHVEADYGGAERALGVGLGVVAHAVLAAIIGGPAAYLSVSDLRVTLRRAGVGAGVGLGPNPAPGSSDPAADPSAEVIALGLVVVWDRDSLGHPLDGPALLTLTPWGAAILGVELVEAVDEYPRWELAEDPDGPSTRGPIRMPRAAGSYGMTLPELVVDPTPPPSHLLDPESGQVVELFAGGGCRGVPVEIDRRLGKGEKGRGKERKKGKGRKRVA